MDLQRLILKPASPGTGIIAGGAVRQVLELVGITNILSKVTGSSNPVNVVKAVQKGLMELRDPLMVARDRGINLKQLFSQGLTSMASKKIEIKLVKSPIGYKSNVKKTLEALGLTKMNKTVVKNINPQIQGMIKTIEFLIKTKEI